MPQTIAYLRVSTAKQDNQNQELEIRRYCEVHELSIDQWFKVEMSGTRSVQDRQIDKLMDTLNQGDTLIVAELSRLGRSLSQVVMTVEALSEKRVTFISIKEGMKFNGEMDLGTTAQLGLFALLAQIERKLLSERTKAGLERAKAQGKKLGRPKGLGKSQLDDKREEIEDLLAKGVSKASVAKIVGVGKTTLHHWIQTRLGG